MKAFKITKENEEKNLILCGVNVGSVNAGLVAKYDIETKSHIMNLEGHIKRKLREEFGKIVTSPEDVYELTEILKKEKEITIAEWFTEYMEKCIKEVM